MGRSYGARALGPAISKRTRDTGTSLGTLGALTFGSLRRVVPTTARSFGGVGAVALAFMLGGAGCASPNERPEDRVEKPRRPDPLPDPTPAQAPPSVPLAPASRWRTALGEVAPRGWTVSDAIDQIDAPTGWVRRTGDRGVRFELASPDGSARVSLTLMPEGFEGLSAPGGVSFRGGHVVPGIAAKPIAGAPLPELAFGPNADGYVLFVACEAAGAWRTAEKDVSRALGAKRLVG